MLCFLFVCLLIVGNARIDIDEIEETYWTEAQSWQVVQPDAPGTIGLTVVLLTCIHDTQHE